MDRPKRLLSEYNGLLKENDDLYRNAIRQIGLSECSFWILYLLRDHDRALTQSDIGATMHLPKQTINSALKKLEGDGYIRLLAGNDKRSKLVCLTPKGSLLAEKTVDCVIGAELKALDELTEEEQNAFIGLFRKFNALLKNELQKMKV